MVEHHGESTCTAVKEGSKVLARTIRRAASQILPIGEVNFIIGANGHCGCVVTGQMKVFTLELADGNTSCLAFLDCKGGIIHGRAVILVCNFTTNVHISA